jgi:uncharacterized protein YkwD
MVRGRAVVVVLAALVVCVALVPSVALGSRVNQTRQATAVELGVLEQLNQIRAAHHLHALTLNAGLSQAALVHSQDMLAKGYFDHSSADGQPFWKRILTYYPTGSGYWSVGENLFWSSGQATATQSTNAWMDSPEHRANILNPAWRQIGVAAVTSPSAPGTYEGLAVTVVTTDFGVRH